MTPDLLDDLLDSSQPAPRASREQDLVAMIADARGEVPRRRRRIALASGALALALVGGAGVAVATDGFAWAPWAQDPVGAVSFTMSNGFDCELRFAPYTGGSDASLVADVNHTLEDWYRTTDVVDDARALLPQKHAEWAAMKNADDEAELERQLAELSPEERVSAIAHNAWVDEWIAWELAVGDLETQALRDADFPVPDDRLVGTERVSGIQCLDLEGDLYMPGAGS